MICRKTISVNNLMNNKGYSYCVNEFLCYYKPAKFTGFMPNYQIPKHAHFRQDNHILNYTR